MEDRNESVLDMTALIAQMHRCSELLLRLNAMPEGYRRERDAVLTELLGSRGARLHLRSPFNAIMGNNIHLGENCFINMNCTFLDDAAITVGSYVLIAPDVKIYTASHPTDTGVRWGKMNKWEGFEYPVTHTLPVSIGDRAWIGGGAVIMPGVTIGEGAVIGAGSVVTRDIPAAVVACGNPCRIIKSIN
ncbi:MAG: sugar O-acetyltransferase [Cloacibacillus sp.]